MVQQVRCDSTSVYILPGNPSSGEMKRITCEAEPISSFWKMGKIFNKYSVFPLKLLRVTFRAEGDTS